MAKIIFNKLIKIIYLYKNWSILSEKKIFLFCKKIFCKTNLKLIDISNYESF